ncbi:uncharacterized protein RJT20DRAFT_58715 [Scheffersomyces xylosifermentans]|uniref:uncharacterized protein n=1 Tax=Scheffersomyces xylosifermentans TaxID=1304137 RepID=UPI00315C6E98
MKTTSIFFLIFFSLVSVYAQNGRGYQEAMFLFTKGYTSFGNHSGIIEIPSESFDTKPFESPYFKEVNFYSYDSNIKLIALKAILRAATAVNATGDILYLYNYIVFNGQSDCMTLDYSSEFSKEVCYYLNAAKSLSIKELQASTTDKLLAAFYKDFPVEKCRLSKGANGMPSANAK